MLRRERRISKIIKPINPKFKIQILDEMLTKNLFNKV